MEKALGLQRRKRNTSSCNYCMDEQPDGVAQTKISRMKLLPFSALDRQNAKILLRYVYSQDPLSLTLYSLFLILSEYCDIFLTHDSGKSMADLFHR